MKKIFLLSAAFFCSGIMLGQTGVQTQAKVDVNNSKVEAFKKQHDDVTAKSAQSIQASTYFGYDETLKSFLNNGVIPNEVPKSDGTLTKEQYVKVLNEWISKNKNLLKPEHKQSLIK